MVIKPHEIMLSLVREDLGEDFKIGRRLVTLDTIGQMDFRRSASLIMFLRAYVVPRTWSDNPILRIVTPEGLKRVGTGPEIIEAKADWRYGMSPYHVAWLRRELATATSERAEKLYGIGTKLRSKICS